MRHYADRGNPFLFIGYAGHEEVNGTSGEAPDSTVLVQSEDEARVVEVPEPGAGVLPDPTTRAVHLTMPGTVRAPCEPDRPARS